MENKTSVTGFLVTQSSSDSLPILPLLLTVLLTQITWAIFHCTLHGSEPEFTSDTDSADEIITKVYSFLWRKNTQLCFHPSSGVMRGMCSVVRCMKLSNAWWTASKKYLDPSATVYLCCLHRKTNSLCGDFHWRIVVKSAWWSTCSVSCCQEV